MRSLKNGMVAYMGYHGREVGVRERRMGRVRWGLGL